MDLKMLPLSQSSHPMIRDWLQHIQQVNSEHNRMLKDGIKFFMPFVAIPTSVVKTIFMLIEKLQLTPKTKYLSIYLYDKFMCNQFWEVYQECGNNPESIEWQRAVKKMSNNARLRLMSCVQIASKMDCHSMGLGISQVISALQLMDNLSNVQQEYHPSMIFHSEFKVFKTVEFQIPLVTPLDAIEVLLAALNINDVKKIYKTAVDILDFTYLQHDHVYAQIQLMATGAKARTKAEKINLITIESDILLLSTAVIMCTLIMFKVNETVLREILDELEKLVDIVGNDICIFAHVIFSLINPTEVLDS